MKRKSLHFFLEYWSIPITVFFFTVSFVYLMIVGEGLYLVVFDNLDSNVAWLKMLKDKHLFWTFDTQVPFLAGIDRDYLYSDLKFYSILYMILPTFAAYIIGWYMRIIMSIVSFWFLGKTIYGKGKDINIYIICGLLHGIIPIYPTCGLGFASLPFLMAILVRLYKKRDRRYIFILVLYPLVSEFSFFGIFICGYIAIFLLVDWIVKKSWAFRLIAGMFGLILGYYVTEWRLFHVMLFSKVEPIRTTFSTGNTG